MNPQFYQEMLQRRGQPMSAPMEGGANAATPASSGGGSIIDRIKAYLAALTDPYRRKTPIGRPGSQITPTGEPIEEPTPSPVEP